jgi:DNA-directed RNA polymerase subunit RPC12/RpoP
MKCGKTIYFPSVDPETRKVICTHCRQPALIEIPREEVAVRVEVA